MLVPLTDPENPHSKMMLELIADQTPFPRSPYPRRETELLEPGTSRRYVAGVLAVLVSIFLAAVVLNAARVLQS
jgi:hypothetical protein